MAVKSNYWDLTNRPHTEKKLAILADYLPAWADIILSQYKKHPTWQTFRTPYLVDCFAGRGKYHKNGVKNCVNGSPLIALNCALEKKRHFQEKYNLDINIQCILVEKNKRWAKDLMSFCEPFEKLIPHTIYYEEDINIVIDEILSQVGSCPTFFFIDPGGIKELRVETIEKIVNKNGARDLLLTYIKDGPKRIVGLAKKRLIEGLPISGSEFKTIKSLEDWGGLAITEYFDKSEREVLRMWAETVLKGGNPTRQEKDQLEVLAYDVQSPWKKDVFYYLLFASRKNCARKIMRDIFKKGKSIAYNNQLSLIPPSDHQFDI